MNDITKTKMELEKKYAQYFCHVSDIDQCPNKEHCTCKIAAEIKAYIREILPTPFSNLTLEDFDGCDKNNNRLISAKVALEAKKSVITYQYL